MTFRSYGLWSLKDLLGILCISLMCVHLVTPLVMRPAGGGVTVATRSPATLLNLTYMTLQSFPRGGEKRKSITNSVQVFQKKKGKKKEKKKVAKESNEELNFIARTAERLSNATLCEGLKILGRICEVKEYELIVSLPGGLNGQLTAPNISKSYNDLLISIVRGEVNQVSQYKPLTELYDIGEYIVCYIQSTQADGKWNIQLSLESHLINQNVDIKYLVIGTRLVCSVSSVEDHGYILDTGIPNVRAFISIKDIDADKKYFVGKQIFCCIKELQTTNNVTTINLSTIQKLIHKVADYEIESLDVLTPGTRVPLRVRKILSNGLQVSYGKGHIGYINRIYMDKSVSSYTEDIMINGTLMYIMPTVKFGYFSLITKKMTETAGWSHEGDNRMNRGEIVEKATVLFRESNGIVLRLDSRSRGFVSFHRTDIGFDKMTNKFIPDSVHKCRILFYNWMEKMYICTMQQDELQEKYFTESDLSIGDILRVQIKTINTENNYMTVSIGRITGTVASDHISDFGSNVMGTLKVGQSIEARVLNINREKRKVQFTLKESLLKSNLPILSDISNAKCGTRHHGTIVQINKNGLLIRFFGEAKGWLPFVYLDKTTASVNWNYSIGQTIAVYIESVNETEGKMKLNLISNIANMKNSGLLIGQVVEGNIIEASTEGIRLQIKDKDEYTQEGFLPAGHMAPCIEIGRLLASKCIPGDVISALVFATEPNLLLSRTFLTDEKHRELKQLKVGDSIPSSIKDIAQDGVRVVLPINNYKKYGFVPYNRISNFDMIHANQMLFVKVINIDKKEEQLNLTMSLEKLWTEENDEGLKIMGSVDLLNLYFNKIKELMSNPYYEGRPILNASIGQVVTGRIDKITSHGLVLKLEKNLEGTVRKDHYSGNVKVGDEVSGKILWINYVHEFVEVTLLPSIVHKINSKQNVQLPAKTLLRGEIVMVSQWFILVVLKGKGKGTLAALPVRRHVNDLRPDSRPYIFLSRIRCYAILNKHESDIMPICMLKSAFEVSRKAALSKVIRNQQQQGTLKRKSISINGEERMKMQNYPKKNSFYNANCCIERFNGDQLPRKRKLEEESVTCKKKKLKKKIQNLNGISQTEIEFGNEENPKDDNNIDKNNQDKRDNEKVIDRNVLGIPQCGFYWDTMPDARLVADIQTSSDSEDDVEEQEKKSKVKKLSAAQRRERERQKEREIREREEALASNRMPNSVDQFDRLVLASPDSSLVWLQYMAYHLQATEVEKARAIARRAIKTINFREENEKLNVWNAWLNLESKFGTPEALNDVFQEAVRTNDALKVYTHMLTVYSETGRQFELEKLVNTFIGKFKQNPKVWLECGGALLKLGLKDKSRQVMQRALQSLPSSEHVNIMLRFANLENQFGEKERSQTLFEQILSSYPKRVDIWSSYVDSLVKSEEISIARKVLERAIVQNLPPKKMKVLFKKFISFEEKHGTPEDVEHVQRAATDYIENQCGERVN
ncbi:protein RRP5 homolog isoform X2 [Vespa mandarinia]|uniref:protein RRP5 homolog isoform X2 n=1 Tax=Vespa mandarinia TaxID=7446 RepID=UPI00160CE59A|nr:protein RRP5 homolog isoform X2 [Vespa mandarinia]